MKFSVEDGIFRIEAAEPEEKPGEWQGGLLASWMGESVVRFLKGIHGFVVDIAY